MGTPAILKPSEALRAGAALIRERGWAQHDYESDDGRLCLLGAMNVAYTGASCAPQGETPTLASARKSRDYLVAATGHPYPDNWNDREGRTKEEVISALETAAQLAEGDSQ